PMIEGGHKPQGTTLLCSSVRRSSNAGGRAGARYRTLRRRCTKKNVTSVCSKISFAISRWRSLHEEMAFCGCNSFGDGYVALRNTRRWSAASPCQESHARPNHGGTGARINSRHASYCPVDKQQSGGIG